MAHKHSVRDTNAHFTIDQFTRQIKNDSANKTTIVQYDHNSERLTFEMPLYVDGHAMTLCDLIEIHYINISTDGENQNHGTYEVKDITAEGEKAVFTWLISQECTQFAGSLSFFIVFKCTENGVTVYRWATEICKTLAISEGMDNGETVLTEYPDILAQWKAQIFGASDNAVLAVEAAKTSALAAIEAAGDAKKQAVLDSIPDEYEALSALADQNHRNKAGAIVLNAEGESIVVNDASEYPLQNLKVFGKSTQDGTPTPDAPVDIVSVENAAIKVCGKNLLNLPQIISKDRAIYNYDLFTGTAGSSQPVPAEYFDKLPVLKAGVDYYFSYNIPEDVEGKKILIQVVSDSGETSINNLLIEEPGIVRVEKDTRVTIRANSSAVYTIEDIQLDIGTKKTDYEPYTEQEITIPCTLPGIPVSSGGNYTDANGQQWICDEVDLARGVYVQRVGQLVLDGTAKWNAYNYETIYYGFHIWDLLDEYHSRSPGMCNQFETVGSSSGDCIWVGASNANVYAISKEWYDKGLDAWKAHLNVNPLKIVYARITPIETPLSEAEINAFKALHTNKPNTTILNDAGAHMAIEYVADTKTYIDNKIARLTNT